MVRNPGITCGKSERTVRSQRERPKRRNLQNRVGSEGPQRDFRIVVGLRVGWDRDGRVYDVSEVVKTAQSWMQRRVEANLPALSGMTTRGEVTYAWRDQDGCVQSDREPVAIFSGEAVHDELGPLSDHDLVRMLNELAAELGAALGQERLHISFRDRTWVLEAGESD